MKIYFVRHGDRENFAGDPPLTQIGIDQAGRVGEYFKSQVIDAVFTSPQARARETAKVIADKLGLKSVSDDRLKERMNWGEIPGQSFEDFVIEWQKATEDRNYIPNQGVSAHAAGQRIKEFVTDIDNGAYKSILIASHGGSISDFLYNIFDLRIDAMDFCSVTEVEKESDKFTFIRANDIACWENV